MTKAPNAIFTLIVKSLLTNCKNFSTIGLVGEGFGCHL
jgi:hypothetical protein